MNEFNERDRVIWQISKCFWIKISKCFWTASNLSIEFFYWFFNRALKVWECQECLNSIVNLKKNMTIAMSRIQYFSAYAKIMMNFSTITLAIYIWYNMFKICSWSMKSIRNTLVNKNSSISWKQSINFKSKNHNEMRTKLDTQAKIKQQISQKSKSIIRMQAKIK